jgi:hypothetical protein
MKKKTKTKIGRKIKLTPELIESFSKKLQVGSYAKYVAMSEGITERTYYRWLERGEKAEKLHELRKKVPKSERLFCQLCQSVKQSEAQAQIVLTTMVFSQAKEDWHAALAIMSRKWPEQWAKKEYLDFKGTIDQGPNKREQAINEYETMFKGVPRAELSVIMKETTRKIRDAKNNHSEKNKKPKQHSNTRSRTKV